MALCKVKEGAIEFYSHIDSRVSKDLPVFYNPAMRLNRDLTILILKGLDCRSLCDPLCGCGVRAIRFARELGSVQITANDISRQAVLLTRRNMRLNSVRFDVFGKDANILFMESKGFDYIDLDVFGSPNFVLDSAIRRLSRNGVLAVTATDTAALCGTYPNACRRKYWASPRRDEQMHETGLRILIRKVQLIGAQYERAMIPIFSYFKRHYFRIFFRAEKGKSRADAIIKNHGEFNGAGPMWLGELWDSDMVRHVKSLAGSTDKELADLIGLIAREAGVASVGICDIHSLVKRNCLPRIPKREYVISAIEKKGYLASESHICRTAIRTNCPEAKIIDLISGQHDSSSRPSRSPA
ncbi:MAG: hypothetical protein ABH879_08425 [archaeon]